MKPPVLSFTDFKFTIGGFSVPFDQFDLFGEPIVSRDRPQGRPRLPRDVEKALLVSGLSSLGFNQAKIAADIGISEPTLRRIYGHELGANPETAKRRAARATRKENGNG